MIGRTYVVTGSASGIGRATAGLLRAAGHRVIGVDRRDADVVADLGTAAGRRELVEGVQESSEGRIDAVIACAGVGGADLRGGLVPFETVVRVNYFGAVATLEGLRPLLAGSEAPRAATITSIVFPVDPGDELIAACLAGDEERATALCLADAYANGRAVYGASKRALARWVRRTAPEAAWAGAGITLNAAGPAAIETPMTRDLFATPALRARITEGRPMPLRGGGLPEHVGALLAWLTSAENGFVTGQIVFCDGGHDAVLRGDNVW